MIPTKKIYIGRYILPNLLLGTHAKIDNLVLVIMLVKKQGWFYGS
jgi:hypothetical protein